MTDPTPAGDPTPPGTDPGTNPPAAQGDPKPPTAEDIANLTKALEKERELRKAREKDLSEFRSQQRQSMTDAERALAEAREQAAAEVRTQYGARLARTEYIAEAAKRNPGYDVAAVLDDINLARFIGDDGEPDSKAIAASVARLVPEATAAGPAGPPSFDGGARTTAPAGPDMNRLMRQAVGRT
jgi:predicted secreted protein